MSQTITWAIQWMNVSTAPIEGHSEVVLTAGWQCTANQVVTGTPDVWYSTSASGLSAFPMPATGGSFTPYDQLTQEQVLGWCWANGVVHTAVEAEVTAQLANHVSPPTTTPPLPWAAPAA